MTHAQPRKHPNVRQSTDAYLEAIHVWLKHQERDGVQGTFLCNWRLTATAHEDGGLLVYVHPQTEEPLGYQWGGLVTSGILEIRNDMRGRGIGRALVEHCLALAAEDGNDILSIQCKPRSSIRFWKAMGFQLLGDRPPEEQENHAYRVMPRKHDLPEGDGTAQVTIEWFPQERMHDASVPAVSAQSVQGVWFGDELELTERASFCLDLVKKDVVVRVVVDGQEWYCGKAKHDGAENTGVQRCKNGFCVDALWRVPEQE